MNKNIFLLAQMYLYGDPFDVSKLHKIGHLRKLAQKDIEIVDDMEWSVLMYLVIYDFHKNQHILNTIHYWLRKARELNKLEQILNYQEYYGNETPLSICVSYKNAMIAQILLERGAKVDTQNYSGYTPLHEAVYNGDKVMVRLLLKYKASTTITDNRGHTVIDICNDTEIKDMLINC